MSPAASGTCAAVKPYCSPWRRSTHNANASQAAKATTSHSQPTSSGASAMRPSPAAVAMSTPPAMAVSTTATTTMAFSPRRDPSTVTLASPLPLGPPGHGALRRQRGQVFAGKFRSSPSGLPGAFQPWPANPLGPSTTGRPLRRAQHPVQVRVGEAALRVEPGADALEVGPPGIARGERVGPLEVQLPPVGPAAVAVHDPLHAGEVRVVR